MYYNQILEWLREHENLTLEQQVEGVKLFLKDADRDYLLTLSACLYMQVPVNEEFRLAREEADLSMKSYNKTLRFQSAVAEMGMKMTTEHLASQQKQREGANKARREKFKTIEQDLKQCWLNNISPDKRATDAAILLEKTDIFRQSSTAPKRSTLEGYVRRWQKGK